MKTSTNYKGSKVPSLLQEMEEDIREAEKLLKGFKGLNDEQIAEGLKGSHSRFLEAANLLGKSSLRMKLHQWLGGTLLNLQKKKLGHGLFGKWRQEHLNGVMSERTTNRWMALAKEYRNARMLLEAEMASLTSADSDPPTEGGGAPAAVKSKAEKLLTSLSGLQKSLRQFSTSGESFDVEQLVQLKVVRAELDQFMDKVVSQANETAGKKGGLES